jgi:hypothetical protein
MLYSTIVSQPDGRLDELLRSNASHTKAAALESGRCRKEESPG